MNQAQQDVLSADEIAVEQQRLLLSEYEDSLRAVGEPSEHKISYVL
jgi:hypothetical protein